MKTQGLSLDQAPPLHLPLRFFLTAPLFGVAAGLLLVWRGGDLMLSPLAPQTVALAHLLTLGLITMVIVGALYQLVPVLVGSPIPRPGLARLVHLGLSAGVVAMAGGLLLDAPVLLWVAVAGLLTAFVVFTRQLTLALARAPSTNVTVWSINLAEKCLSAAIGLGLFFLGEHLFGWLEFNRLSLTAIHIYLALGGWVAMMITGVGYAVIPMFYLASPFPARRAWFVLICQGLTVLSGVGVSLFAPSPVWHLLPILFGGAASAVFIITIWRSLQGRRRRVVDTTLRFWQTGLVALPLSLVALATHSLWPEPRWLLVFGAMFLVGFAASIMNGMLFKIVAFLVWLHRFSKLAGKVNVPLLRDIIQLRRTTWQWRSYVVMLGLLLPAVLTGHDGLVRVAGLAMVVTFGGLWMLLMNAARFRPPLDPPGGKASSDQPRTEEEPTAT